MATAACPSSVPARKARLPSRQFDHLFFSAMAVLLAAAVFIGFARTYYLAGVFRAPLPSLIIHLHGAVFSVWVVLFVTQTALVSARRVDVHRRLGIAAFFWACLMIVLGLLAATDALARGAGPPGSNPKAFFAVPVGDMLIFATLIFFSFRNRTKPAVHKQASARYRDCGVVGGCDQSLALSRATSQWSAILVHLPADDRGLRSLVNASCLQ